MGNWKNMLSANYAFSNNGEKIKRIAKQIYTWEILLFFVAAIIGGIYLLTQAAYIGILPTFLILLAIFLGILIMPHLVYFSLCLLYGFGELVANSYKKNSPSPVANDSDANNRKAPPVKPAPAEKVKDKIEPELPIPPFAKTAPKNVEPKQIHIVYLAKDGAPETASYTIDNQPPQQISNGERKTELIYDDHYKIKFSAGLLRMKETYVTRDNATRTFICNNNKLYEK